MNITAVQLDDILARLTPEMVAVIAHTQPVGRRDQLVAAAAEAIAIAKQGMEATGGGEAHELQHDNVPGWIRLGLLDTLIQFGAGTGRTCIHMPHIDRPQPVWSCAWKPGLVVCAACTPLLKAVGVMDQTCDRCGHVCDGVDAGDPIYALGVVLGPLTYSAGACNDCCDNGTTT
jgi:hypothetical protein